MNNEVYICVPIQNLTGATAIAAAGAAGGIATGFATGTAVISVILEQLDSQKKKIATGKKNTQRV